jgi:hypothetical protein
MPRSLTTPNAWVAAMIVSAVALVLVLAAFSFDFVMLALILGGAGLLAFGAAVSPLIALEGWLLTQPTIEGTVYFNVGPLPAITVDRVLLVLMVVLLLMRWIRRPATVLPAGRLDLVMCLLLAVFLVSTLVKGGSYHPYLPSSLQRDVQSIIQGWATPFVGFWVAKNFVAKRGHVLSLMHCLIGVGVVVSSIALLGYFFDVEIFAPTRYKTTQQDRAHGSLASGSTLGVTLILPALTAFVAMARTRSPARRLMYGAALAVISAGVLFSQTRTSWLAFLIALLVIGCLDSRLRAWLAGLAIAGCLAGVILIAATERTAEFRERSYDASPVFGRLVSMASGLQIFARNPIFGVGYGEHSYSEAIPHHLVSVAGLPPSIALWGVPHNQYVHLLAITGLSGFLPFVVLLFFAAQTGIRAYRRPGRNSGLDRDVPLILLGGLAVFLLNNFFQDAMHYAGPNNNQLFVLLGVVEGFRIRALHARRPELPGVLATTLDQAPAR